MTCHCHRILMLSFITTACTFFVFSAVYGSVNLARVRKEDCVDHTTMVEKQHCFDSKYKRESGFLGLLVVGTFVPGIWMTCIICMYISCDNSSKIHNHQATVSQIVVNDDVDPQSPTTMTYYNSDDVCCICLHSLKDTDATTMHLRCGHIHHTACLQTWISHGGASCPLCDVPFT